jgi:1-acyl-sn-glycerol-3-phosphate acyltransferase
MKCSPGCGTGVRSVSSRRPDAQRPRDRAVPRPHFLAAVEAGVRVQPVALRYGPRASAQTVVAFAPGESFAGNFLRLLGEPARDTEVWFLDPIDTSDAGGRRRIAETARDRIVAAMESP